MEKTIGEALKEIREQKGINLSTISKKTNISVKKLNSLEKNMYSHFPGKFYYIGYVKEYLKTVSYDSNKFFENFDSLINNLEFKKPSAQVQFSKIQYFRFKKKKFFIVVLIVLIILALTYLLFFKDKLDLNNIFGQLLAFLKQ